jgi:dihydropteroate synthase
MELRARDRCVHFPRRPLIMGIVNINDDSFCGDGRLDSQWALERARELVTQGADIVDVGGESARTNRVAITPEEELQRILFWSGSKKSGGTSPRDGQVFPPLLCQYLAPRSSRGRTPIQRASA